MQTTSAWESEALLTSGDTIFESMLEGISNAQESILFETYIFKNDILGQKLAAALIAAAKRNIRVRVIVDGIGSPGWIFGIGATLLAHGIEVKIYKQLPWEKFVTWKNIQLNETYGSILQAFNQRNHRKMCIIDNSIAWVGSMNICVQSSTAHYGPKAWREMGIKVQGADVKYLTAAFELVWYSWFLRHKKFLRNTRRIVLNSRSTLLRLNSTIKLRRFQRRSLLSRINNAKSKIYIASAYFVPHGSVLAALRNAAQRGIDVCILTSEQSDLFFMPWVAAELQRSFLKAGVTVYWYQPRFLHAKYIIIDQWAAVGTSNFNQRSFNHDLEVDVASTKPITIDQLLQEFRDDVSHSNCMQTSDFESRPLWQKICGRALLFFKYFL